MADDHRVRSAKLPAHLDEKFQQFRDEHDLSNSDALRELARRSLQEWEEQEDGKEQPPAGGGGVFGRIFPSLAGVAIVATLVLVTTGAHLAWPVPATAAGAVLTMAGRADKKLDAAIASMIGGARERTQEHGGGLSGAARAAWAALKADHPGPREPTGVVERIAWADLYGHVFLLAATALSVPLYAALQLSSPKAVYEMLGFTGALAYLGTIVLLFYTWSALVIIASIAQVSLATAGEPGKEATPAVEEAEA